MRFTNALRTSERNNTLYIVDDKLACWRQGMSCRNVARAASRAAWYCSRISASKSQRGLILLAPLVIVRMIDAIIRRPSWPNFVGVKMKTVDTHKHISHSCPPTQSKTNCWFTNQRKTLFCSVHKRLSVRAPLRTDQTIFSYETLRHN